MSTKEEFLVLHGVCRIGVTAKGDKVYIEEHEPDEELEQELIDNHKKYMLEHGVVRSDPGAFMSFFIGGSSKDYKKAVVMHVCKHCHVFYREVKNATESVTTEQATGYTVSELKEKEDERHDT